VTDELPPDSSVAGVRGGVAVILGQAARTVAQFVAMVVMARVLGPADFGLVAMATAVTGVMSVVGDFGLSMSVLRSLDMSRRIRDGLFYVNAGLALTVAFAAAASAPLIAGFYGEPRLRDVTMWLAVAVLLNGLAPQYRAELARIGKFRQLGSSDGLSQMIGAGIGVATALAGAGYWSVVVQQVGSATSLLVLLIVGSRYVPVTRPSVRGLSEHIRVGAFTFAAQTTNYASVNLPPVIIGRVLGASAVGLFTRSYQLVALPLVQLAAPLTRVVVPILSRSSASSSLQSRALRVHLLVSCALLSTVSLVFVGGSDLLEFLFGSAWSVNDFTVEILAIGGLFQGAGYINYWLFAQAGRLGTLWGFELAVWVAVTPLYFLGSIREPSYFALIYSFGLFSNWLVVSVFGLPRLGLSPSAFLLASVRRLACVGLAAALGAGVRHCLDGLGLGVVPAIATGCLAWLAIMGLEALIFSRVRSEIVEVYRIARRAILRRGV
jgi:Membrane protein involved in the export of O-antigen and teichoic acid